MTEQELSDTLRGMFTLSEEEIVELEGAFTDVRELARDQFHGGKSGLNEDAVWKRWYAANRRPMDIIKCGEALALYAAKHDFVAIIYEPNGDAKRTLWDAVVNDADISRTHTIARIVGFEWRNDTFFTFVSAFGIWYTISRYDNKGDFSAFRKEKALEVSGTVKAHIKSVCERVGCFYNEDSE